MSLLDVGDKLSSILGFLLALAIAAISLIRYVRRERSSESPQRSSATRLRRALLLAAGCVVLAYLALAILSDPDYALLAIYLMLAFILGDLIGQTVRQWVYTPEVEDRTGKRLRTVDRASMFAWISLLLLLEIGLTVISAQYAKASQVFFQVLFAAGCMLLTYYPYHFELREDYRSRQKGAADSGEDPSRTDAD